MWESLIPTNIDEKAPTRSSYDLKAVFDFLTNKKTATSVKIRTNKVGINVAVK